MQPKNPHDFPPPCLLNVRLGFTVNISDIDSTDPDNYKFIIVPRGTKVLWLKTENKSKWQHYGFTHYFVTVDGQLVTQVGSQPMENAVANGYFTKATE